MTRRVYPLLIAAAALLVLARPALAGPPLLCFPFEIGAAKSLPMAPEVAKNWHATDPKYDVSHLVSDTLALLVPSTPVMVRMETLRRATVYASTNPKVADALTTALKERDDARRPLAAFDYGYFVEASREAATIK
ncbi:MAG: hypothetical protein HY047_11415 [Acidobacteria bacterium]|nr:hypothetical protein [Acidobacteriota bacterium]